MKKTIFLFIITVVIPYMIVLPYVFWRLNRSFGLWVIDSIFLDILGIIIILFSGKVIFPCWFLFQKYGHGTPAPVDPPTTIVRQGLYKYTRNPMYIGYILVVLGEALILGTTLSFVYVGLFIFAVHLYVILWEEPHLIKRFGKDYVDYVNQVSRWRPIFPPFFTK